MGRALALGTLLRDALSVPYWLYTAHVTEDDVSDAPEADELKVAWYVSCVVIRGAAPEACGTCGTTCGAGHRMSKADLASVPRLGISRRPFRFAASCMGEPQSTS